MACICIPHNALDKDWNGEVGYVHPLFDGKIGKFVEKAHNSKGTFVFLLPASTHTQYFHNFFYKKDNVEIRFLEKPNKGFRFGADDGVYKLGKGYVDIRDGKIFDVREIISSFIEE